jgi:hypothetical protein
MPGIRDDVHEKRGRGYTSKALNITRLTDPPTCPYEHEIRKVVDASLHYIVAVEHVKLAVRLTAEPLSESTYRHAVLEGIYPQPLLDFYAIVLGWARGVRHTYNLMVKTANPRGLKALRTKIQMNGFADSRFFDYDMGRFKAGEAVPFRTITDDGSVMCKGVLEQSMLSFPIASGILAVAQGLPMHVDQLDYVNDSSLAVQSFASGTPRMFFNANPVVFRRGLYDWSSTTSRRFVAASNRLAPADNSEDRLHQAMYVMGAVSASDPEKSCMKGGACALHYKFLNSEWQNHPAATDSYDDVWAYLDACAGPVQDIAKYRKAMKRIGEEVQRHRFLQSFTKDYVIMCQAYEHACTHHKAGFTGPAAWSLLQMPLERTLGREAYSCPDGFIRMKYAGQQFDPAKDHEPAISIIGRDWIHDPATGKILLPDDGTGGPGLCVPKAYVSVHSKKREEDDDPNRDADLLPVQPLRFDKSAYPQPPEDPELGDDHPGGKKDYYQDQVDAVLLATDGMDPFSSIQRESVPL